MSRNSLRFGSSLVKKNAIIVTVSLLNGISTFLDYLIPKPSFLKNCSDTIYTLAGISLNYDIEYRLLALTGRVFANGPGDRDSILSRVLPKTQKWYLIPPCLTLSILRCGWRVKWSNPGKVIVPSLHLDEVAIKKRPLGLLSTTAANFTLFYL